MHLTTATFTRLMAVCAAALAVASGSMVAASTFTLIDGEGFEAPDYSTSFAGTGQLEGQFASTFEGFGSAQWVQSPLGGTSTAVVQSAVVASGSQAVRVDRDAGSDDRWAVPITGAPAEPIVCIEWDMLVEEATATPLGSFGPFFGIEAYDDDATSILRMGSLGVDAATGEVLLTDAATGLVPTPGGETVGFGQWNSFRMVLDFSTDRYAGYLNGDLLFIEDFEFPGADQFTDADIAALGASFDPGSQNATGTAYFDNYLVFETDDLSKLPEPASAAMLLAAMVGLGSRRRR
ncbi:MAG: PEP-CTERM sorting domain-containing protein [Planctomycetota bacterium]